MKSYTITVNGTVYDVTVEEKAGGAAAPAAPAQAAAPCTSRDGTAAHTEMRCRSARSSAPPRAASGRC